MMVANGDALAIREKITLSLMTIAIEMASVTSPATTGIKKKRNGT